MSLIYLRGPWPDPVLPASEPEWFYFEVDAVSDRVLRAVEGYAGGRHERNSLALETAREGVPVLSLCHGPFLTRLDPDAPPEPLNAAVFEALWARSVDKPFAR